MALVMALLCFGAAAHAKASDAFLSIYFFFGFASIGTLTMFFGMLEHEQAAKTRELIETSMKNADR